MSKADPLVYTPMTHAVIHFGSPVGSQYTKPKPEEDEKEDQ